MTIPTSQLITMPEGKTLELKRDISSPGNILKTLVAFANTAGGRLLIGIEDDSREVLGVEYPLDEEERICNLIADSIKPRLVPNVELISFEDKTLLILEVYPSGSRPHWLKKEGPEEGVYVRLGSTNRKADRELIAELKRGAEGKSFDEQTLPDRTVDDLDFDAATACFERHRQLVKKDMESLRLVARYQGHLVPTVGGMLLFGKDREMVFPDAWIQCGRFIGKDKADILDHIDIHEHLPVAVERVMEFLKKHAMRGADFSELRRKDVWSIPPTIGLPQPEIIEVGMRVRFIVYLTEGIAVETTDPVTDEVEVESPTQSPTQSNEPIQRLLLALTDEEKSSGTLRGALGIKHRPNFRDNYLHPALDAELIEMTISEKPSSSKQKYRLTAKGKDCLAKGGATHAQ